MKQIFIILITSFLLYTCHDELVSPYDECGVLNGDNSSCTDECGVVNGNNTDMDCNDVCFGDSVLDDCNICDGDNSTCVVDVDGNIYPIIQIGEQIWMAENLKVTRDKKGNSIDFAFPANQILNGNIFGLLYLGETAYNQDICPEGWHVPSFSEWNQLIFYLGGNQTAGGNLKVSGTEYWDWPNSGATNESGFSALPSGYLESNTYSNTTSGAKFWSSSLNSFLSLWSYQLFHNSTSISASTYSCYDNDCYHSVRCLKD